MVIVWLVTVAYIVIGFLGQNYIADTHYMTFSFLIVTTVLIFSILWIGYTKYFFVLFLSFFIRLAMLFVDLSESRPTLPHSGEDTENFYETGLQISVNMHMLDASVYGGLYSKFIGILFNLYGADRLFVQYLNILFALTAILIVIKIFRMLNVPSHVQGVLVVLMAFFPHSLIFSSILLRESIISLMVVLSLYCFIRWFLKKERLSGVASLILVIAGASFHSAIIAIAIGYIFGFISYRHDQRTLRFSMGSVVPFGIFAVIMVYILVFPEVVAGLPLFNKFDQILNNDDNIYKTLSSTRGDTAYLTGLEINNIFQLILFSPIKIIYFIASPMPWSIRNVNDLISFLLDASFYISALVIFIRNFHLVKTKPLLLIVLIAIVASWFIFGLGISNAGTALRHRFKVFYVIIVALALAGAARHKAFQDQKQRSGVGDEAR
ncbi:hypothetical protein ACFOU0_10945 [Salinicoccus sesuvii]|uniref:Glycosyltransferase RgtA/B/C/D-like domain-containing protein n=1 Tax=Salinicoccus sesuvii TaxID=868281 RepID=A0ABV7NA57_9STAP